MVHTDVAHQKGIRRKSVTHYSEELMRNFTMDEDIKIILMTGHGYTHRGIAKALDCEPMDVIKRQYYLRQTGRLKV